MDRVLIAYVKSMDRLISVLKGLVSVLKMVDRLVEVMVRLALERGEKLVPSVDRVIPYLVGLLVDHCRTSDGDLLVNFG